jgi:hypothetical protein
MVKWSILFETVVISITGFGVINRLLLSGKVSNDGSFCLNVKIGIRYAHKIR